MGYAEGLILGFVIVLGLIALLYTGYFHYSKIKKIKEQIADDSFNKEYFLENKKDNKTKNIVLNVFLYTFLVISIAFFTSSIVIKAKNNIFEYDNEYVISINSPSMASNEITNTYLTKNKIKTKLYVHDIVTFKKVSPEQEYKPMDILLYKGKKDGKEILIAHRLLKVNDDGTMILRGDANKVDDPLIKKDDVIGIYSHRLEFLSFMNYVAHQPSLYTAFGIVTAILIMNETSKIIINKEISKIDDKSKEVNQ